MDGLLITGQRLGQLALTLLYSAEISVDIAIARLEPQRLGIAGDRLIQPAALHQGDAKIIVKRSKIRLKPQRLLLAGDGLVDFPEGKHHQPEIGQRVHMVRLRRKACS